MTPAPKTQRKPITFHGVQYPSLMALARELGLHHATVSLANKTGRIATLGKGRGNGGGHIAANAARKQPVSAHGWEWPSQVEAARALGVTPPTVYGALQRGTFGRLVLRRLGAKA